MPVTTNRRSLLKAVAGMGAAAQVAGAAPQSTATGRDYWVGLLARLAEPVLVNLAAGTLKRNMPVECAAGTEASRLEVQCRWLRWSLHKDGEKGQDNEYPHGHEGQQGETPANERRVVPDDLGVPRSKRRSRGGHVSSLPYICVYTAGTG